MIFQAVFGRTLIVDKEESRNNVKFNTFKVISKETGIQNKEYIRSAIYSYQQIEYFIYIYKFNQNSLSQWLDSN